MKHKKLNILGTMSGTSLDGVDLSIIKTNGSDVSEFINEYYFEYPKLIKKKINDYIHSIKNKPVFENKIKISNIITKFYIDKIKLINEINNVDIIGFHGQTVYHDPVNLISLQLGNPQLISNSLNKIVVFDFRTNDIKNGGQGAPIAPIYHKYIIEKLNVNLPSCFVNLGGIANLTYVDFDELIGFDTGPGNCLIDLITQKFFNMRYDYSGSLASKGKVDNNFLNFLLDDNYFTKTYPKSLDNKYFNHYLKNNKNIPSSHLDLLATLTEFTALTVTNSIKKLPKLPNSIIYSGGGVQNLYLIERMNKKLDIPTIDINKSKFNTNFIESQLIAFLSARCIYDLPITFPKTTGVRHPTKGGKVVYPIKNH